MNWVGWDVFIDAIAPSVRGAPAVVIMDAARSAAIRLCEVARIWAWASEPSAVEAGQQRYAFAFGADFPARVSGIRCLRLNGRELSPTSRADWPHGDGTSGTPISWREVEPGVVLLWPTPNENGTLTVVVDLVPSPDAEKCPQFIHTHYQEAVKAGALEELTNTLSQAWTNPVMSNSVFSAEFRRLVARARIREERGGSAAAGINLQYQSL